MGCISTGSLIFHLRATHRLSGALWEACKQAVQVRPARVRRTPAPLIRTSLEFGVVSFRSGERR